MATLPERVRTLDVAAGMQPSGQLVRSSQFVFSYRRDDPAQPAIGLLMPPTQLEYRDSALFPVMDQNLPEGYLFERIRAAFPKQAITPMHLLALIGSNGIGRLSYRLPDAEAAQPASPISREEILNASAGDDIFESLVDAYLSTGIGLSGMQPKIMVPDRATYPIPNLIVKAASDAFPGLAANEFVCLSAARRAGIEVPRIELSADGTLLVLDRFDLLPDGTRLGFEDIAALMGLQVRDVLSERKYFGSYEDVAGVLGRVGVPRSDLAKFYGQIVCCVMMRNGDAHLKNFGVLYTRYGDARLAPMFDVLATAIYRYPRFAGGPPAEDHTMALKLFRGRGNRTYPTTAELLRFCSQVCGVRHPDQVIRQVAQAMLETLHSASHDDRVPAQTLAKMREAWAYGLAHVRELPKGG
jgi:serine/threonine-protein kinase HipA